MNIIQTYIKGLYVIEPNVFEDTRGYFFESYNQNNYREQNINQVFVQDNQSRSSYGVIRGLHYQLNPYSQTKLVRVIEGSILDVAVDIRKGSPTFGRSFEIELSVENKKQLLVPKGFAHGFSVLSEWATLYYKCDEFYSPKFDRGIIYNDKHLGIDWRIPEEKAIISDKDKNHPTLENAEINFTF